MLAESAGGDISLRQLARRVGVTANATYRHFANKNALLAALAAEGFRRLQEGQGEAVRLADPGQGLREAGLAYLRFAWRHPALFRLMFGPTLSHQGDEELTRVAAASFRALRSAVAVARGVDEEAAGVEGATLRTWGLVHGLSHLMLDGQFGWRAESPLAVAEQALTDAVDGPL
ncbi:TetR family transcriptional regulator [Alcanivorax xiamenensis]|uniref:TetR family transcriptional regulator n=1 Tax=Alcanivorax xiamenensis TaxID=1177156 RepID=A0ABQ6YDX2_9GAMM|nr:TetR family transcriptional regulator [Alcanivorax xiamenensis]